MSEVVEDIDEADELAPLHAQIAAALPVGWTLETLGSLCEKSQYGWTTKADKAGSGVKFLRTTDITPGVVDWNSVPYCVEAPGDLEKYLIKDGDILISRSGSIGVNYLVVKPEPAVFASYLIRFRPKTSISTKYLRYYLQSPAYWRAINKGKKGIAVQNVNATMLARIPVPVAPPAVQDEIVAELEKQFSRLDEAVANLQRVKANLKRYKAAVLKAAVEGRLVETEATLARREGRTYETGAQLLTSAATEHGAQRAAKRKSQDASTSVVKSLPKLTDGWVWSCVEEVGRLQLGRQRAPKYHAGANMRPYLRVQNVFEDRIDLSDVMEMDFSEADFERFELHSGDVLLNEGQSPEFLGRPAIYRNQLPGVCFTNTLIRFQAYRCVLPEFALVYFRHCMHSGRFAKESNITTNIAHLSLGRLAAVEFPVPPLAEQQRIIFEFDRQMSIVREVEAEVDANLLRALALRQATLSKMFGGAHA